MGTELEHLEVFKALEEKDLTFIRRRVQSLTMRRGQVLYTYADLAHNMYFVAKGRVKLVSISDEGEEFIKALIGPGRMFGGQGLIGAVSYGEIAEVQLEGRLFVLRARDVRGLMMSNAGFRGALLKNVSKRLGKAERRLEDVSFRDGRTRIRDFLFD